MTIRKVAAGNGWQWIKTAIDVVKRHPVPFLVMGLILAIIGVIPVLGGLITLILGPALIGGMCYAAQQADTGRTPEIGHLFRAFQESDRIGSLIALCIPMIVGAVVIGILVAIFVFGAIASAGGMALLENAEANPMILFGALGASALILVPLVIIIGLAIYAFTFFAIPRTMLERAEGFANMKDSFAACRRNFGAFFVCVIVLLLAAGILSAIFNAINLAVIGGILVSTALYALLGPTLYHAWRDVYGDAAAVIEAPAAPPPPAD